MKMDWTSIRGRFVGTVVGVRTEKNQGAKRDGEHFAVEVAPRQIYFLMLRLLSSGTGGGQIALSPSWKSEKQHDLTTIFGRFGVCRPAQVPLLPGYFDAKSCLQAIKQQHLRIALLKRSLFDR